MIRFFVLLCGLEVMVYGAPITWKMVDLTHQFDEHASKYPIFKPFSMEVVINETYNDGIWLQAEEYASTTHAGTHMDSPAHMVAGGATIEQVPIDTFIGPAAVIDIVEKASLDVDAEVTVEDLQKWEDAAGRSLDGTIVFMRSGWSAHYYNKTAYVGTTHLDDTTQMRFPGFSPEAAKWLVDHRHIKGTGVDTLSLDKGISTDFGAHQNFLNKGIYILENVANLEKMPIYGATVYVMPMKIKGASGAPTRIVATYPDLIFKQ